MVYIAKSLVLEVIDVFLCLVMAFPTPEYFDCNAACQFISSPPRSRSVFSSLIQHPSEQSLKKADRKKLRAVFGGPIRMSTRC